MQSNNNASPAPIRIYVVYQLDNTNLDSSTRDFLQVTQSCGDNLSNIPQDLFGDIRICQQPFDQACSTQRGGQGAPNADYVLVVSAVSSQVCGGDGLLTSTIATGGQCLVDRDGVYGSKNRPLAGFANFCPNKISTDPANFNFMVDTATHEIMHGLVISDNLFEQYIDPSTNEVIGNVISQVSGSNRRYVSTPAVRNFVRTQLDCDTAPGAYLEDEGGMGTAVSHWERSIFDSELMIGTAFDNRRGVFSNLTMALLEDSGWYQPSYSQAGLLQFGQQGGCDFLDLSQCTRHQPYFCTNDTVTQGRGQTISVCSYSLESQAYCPADAGLTNGCPIVTPLKGGSCVTSSGRSQFGQLDAGQKNGAGSRCLNIKSKQIARRQGGIQFSANIDESNAIGCYQLQCQNDQLTIIIPANDEYPSQEIQCTQPGQIVSVPQSELGFSQPYQLQCPPDLEAVCAGLGCPVGPNGMECSGHGYCSNKLCYCNIGYNGTDCATVRCEGQGECAVSQYDGSSGGNSDSSWGSTEGNNTARTSGMVQNMFYATLAGYLANCPQSTGTSSSDSDGQIVYTDEYGRVPLPAIANAKVVQSSIPVLNDNSSSQCTDVFTKLKPTISFLASSEARTQSPLTSLAYFCQQIGDPLSPEGEGPALEPEGAPLTADLLSAPPQADISSTRSHMNTVLGLAGIVDFISYDIIQNTVSTDFQYQSQYQQAYAISIQVANTVQLMAAYFQGVMKSPDMYKQGLSVQKAIAFTILQSQDQISFTSARVLGGIMELARNYINDGDVDNKKQNIELNSDSNQALFDVLAKVNGLCTRASQEQRGIGQVNQLAAIQRSVQADITPDANKLGEEGQSQADSFATTWNSTDSINNKVNEGKNQLGDTRSITDQAAYADQNGRQGSNNSDRLRQNYAGVPGWGWIIIGVVIVLAIIGLALIPCCCRRSRRPNKHHSGQFTPYNQNQPQNYNSQYNQNGYNNNNNNINSFTPPPNNTPYGYNNYQSQGHDPWQQPYNQGYNSYGYQNNRSLGNNTSQQRNLGRASNGEHPYFQEGRNGRVQGERSMSDQAYKEFVNEQRAVLERYQQQHRNSQRRR